ncbi:Mu transposase domain-containing protein [Sorangium sp. So ce513]|uniref:Mu transposase domain-containing protein n=1 Tax=Sorangium sp. So ce513 TaxID=3133315 RepID=UPI003F6445DE
MDYHFEYDHRLYSVPSELLGAKVDVRATATVVEVWRGGARVTSHERSYGPKGTAVTKPPSARAPRVGLVAAGAAGGLGGIDRPEDGRGGGGDPGAPNAPGDGPEGVPGLDAGAAPGNPRPRERQAVHRRK